MSVASNVSGGLTAGGGITTGLGSKLEFLEGYSLIVGMGFTAATFTIYALCSYYDLQNKRVDQANKRKQDKLDTELKQGQIEALDRDTG